MAVTVKEGAGGNGGGTRGESEVYGGEEGSYTGSVSFPLQKWREVFLIGVVAAGVAMSAQEPAKEPAKAESKPQEGKPSEPKPQNEKPAAKSEEKATLPFEIELLETRVRFEANGNSRKEVHTVVRINDAGGARQFARLGFDYNRAFQSVEIPQVKIAHANGGTSEILPSAITDVANPAVEKFPAYQDVRMKTVRILGLQEGDTLEYRVITTTTKPPLAPDFWLEHTFDRSGQVLEEHYELDLPKPERLEVRINPQTPATRIEPAGHTTAPHTIYQWDQPLAKSAADNPDLTGKPDIAVSTYDWDYLGWRLAEALLPGSKPFVEAKTTEEYTKELDRQPEVTPVVKAKALSLTQNAKNNLERLKAIYRFVSTQIRTVDLPPGATGFHVRPAQSVLESGYGNSEDKYVLFAAMAEVFQMGTEAAFTGFCDKSAVPNPMRFRHLIVGAYADKQWYWLDPVLEVAPFGMIASPSCRTAFVMNLGFASLNSSGHEWEDLPESSSLSAFQKVSVEASISGEGTLKAKLKYITRGENELVLRMAFHQAPKERWNEVAGLLALSDGFRGHIESVKASDPLETEKPFEVEYEITQPKFVDWAKKPVRIPALLPQIALPDAPGKAGGTIELGTPLEVETEMTLKLPEGTTVQTPPGTAVSRDYATYASKYGGHLNTVTASRHVHFLLREIPGDRATDYRAFTRAVKLDETQAIGLFVPEQAEKK